MGKPGEKKRKRKPTIGDTIRKHMAVEDVGTDKALKFLKLPNDGRFDTAGMYYAAALDMLNKLVDTLEGVMVSTVLKTTRPANQPPDPESDAAVIRSWKLLEKYGIRLKITKIVPVKKTKKR